MISPCASPFTSTDGKEFLIDDLLRIEDDPAILDFCCPTTGLPLWIHARIPIFRMIILDALYRTALVDVTNAPVGIGQKLATLGRSLIHNVRFHPRSRKSEVCLISPGIGNQWLDGRWFNRLTDHFSHLDPQNTLVLEDHFQWRWQFPRSNNRVMFLAPRRAYNVVIGKLTVGTKERNLARQLLDFVCARAEHCLNWRVPSELAIKLIDELARKIASAPQEHRRYQKLLREISPKLVMVGAAPYGGLYATFIDAARRMGIPTAEYQHGAVSAGHDAYNFAPAVQSSSIFRRAMPDYFLGYGEWWNTQINAPMAKVIIGNPNRERQLDRVSSFVQERKSDVLILSDGYEFGLYLDLARAIEPFVTKNGLRLVVRPHPLERARVAGHYGTQVGAIRIDENPDIFSSLIRADLVVSEISTGLFDAIGVSNRIFIWNTHKTRFGYPVHPFQSFSTPSELIGLIEYGAGSAVLKNVDKFWAPNWRENYRNFLSTIDVTYPSP